MERHIDNPNPIPRGFVVKKGSKDSIPVFCINARARIFHRDQQAIGLPVLGLDAQRSRLLGCGTHRLDGICNQVQDHLLQLYAVGKHADGATRQLQHQGDLLTLYIRLQETDDVLDQLVDL